MVSKGASKKLSVRVKNWQIELRMLSKSIGTSGPQLGTGRPSRSTRAPRSTIIIVSSRLLSYR